MSSVERVRSAHLPDQQSYQTRHGNGAHGFLLIRASTSTSTAANLSCATAADCDKLSPAAATAPATMVSGRSDLFLSEIGYCLGQPCDVVAQPGQIGNGTPIGHFFRRILCAAPCRLSAARNLIVCPFHLRRFVVSCCAYRPFALANGAANAAFEFVLVHLSVSRRMHYASDNTEHGSSFHLELSEFSVGELLISKAIIAPPLWAVLITPP